VKPETAIPDLRPGDLVQGGDHDESWLYLAVFSTEGKPKLRPIEEGVLKTSDVALVIGVGAEFGRFHLVFFHDKLYFVGDDRVHPARG
jgi:hypothetical protein